MPEKSRRTILKTMAGTGAVGSIYGSTTITAQEQDCDLELDALNFGEVCIDEGGENCLEADLTADLGDLPLDVFELADVEIEGDADVFEVDASLDGSNLGITGSFCPTLTGDFEATAVITVEDPLLGITATVCLGLFGTGIECPEGCDLSLETIDFGEVCAGDGDNGGNGDNGDGGECLTEEVSIDLSELPLPLDVFELADVEVVGDVDVFEADVTLEDGVLGASVEFCPTFPDDFEATIRITIEDPNLGIDSTVCVGLSGTGIQCGPEFDVGIESTNDPVEAGQPLEVDALVENVGDEEGTQEVTLALDGEQQDSVEVTLGPDESETVTLSAPTDGLDPGDYPATVSSEDTEDETTVTVEEGEEPTGPDLQVGIEATNDPVEAGQPLEVDALVENVGDEGGTQEVTLALDGEQQDSVEVTLGAGESETVTLTAPTEGLEPGDYPATVSSDDDSEETTVTVEEGPGEPAEADFQVDITETNSPVAPGESLGVGSVVENAGEGEGTQEIVFELDGEVQDSVEVTLGPGEQEAVSLSGETDGLEPGDYPATVSSDDNSDETTVTIEESEEPTGPDLQVEVTETNDPVEPGEPLEVETVVENVGDEEGTQDVSLGLDGEEQDSVEVTVGPGETETVTLTAPTDGLEPGDYPATVSSDDDSEETTVTVEEATGDPSGPDLQVEVSGANDPVDPGETLEVEAVVENVGDEEGTQEVALEFDGEEQDSVEVTLGAGESETVTLTAPTDGLEPGDYPATVSSEDDSDETTVTVGDEDDDGEDDDGDGDDGEDDDGEGDDGEDDDGDGDDGEDDDGEGDDGEGDDGEDDDGDGDDGNGEGDDGEDDDGEGDDGEDDDGEGDDGEDDDGDDGEGDDGEGDDGDGEDDDGEGDDGEDGAGDDGEGDDGEGDDGEEDATTGPDLQVGTDGTNAPVNPGEQLEVDASVENVGDEEGTQEIVLELDGEEQDSVDVTVGPGESESVTLTADTSGLGSGRYTASVSSDDDCVTTTIRVC